MQFNGNCFTQSIFQWFYQTENEIIQKCFHLFVRTELLSEWFDVWPDLWIGNYILWDWRWNLFGEFFIDSVHYLQCETRVAKMSVREKIANLSILAQQFSQFPGDKNGRAHMQIARLRYIDANRKLTETNNYGIQQLCDRCRENMMKTFGIGQRMGPSINFIGVYGHTNAMTSPLIRIHSL